MERRYVYVLRVRHREANAAHLQALLTEHGASIRMRLGMHEGGDMHDGVILLHLCCKNDAAIALRDGLDGLRGIEFSALELDV